MNSRRSNGMLNETIDEVVLLRHPSMQQRPFASTNIHTVLQLCSSDRYSLPHIPLLAVAVLTRPSPNTICLFVTEQAVVAPHSKQPFPSGLWQCLRGRLLQDFLFSVQSCERKLPLSPLSSDLSDKLSITCLLSV